MKTTQAITQKIKLLLCASLFFIFHSSLFISTATAQQPWNYTSVAEAHLDDAYFVAPPAALKAKVLKEIKITRPVTAVEQIFNSFYRLTVDKNNRLCFQSDSLIFSLPEDIVTELFPYLVSRRYWQQRYERLQQWAFVDMNNTHHLLDVDTADHRYGRYAPLSWLGYTFQPSEQWPIVFSVRTNTHKVQLLTLPALQRLAEWGAFTTDDAQHAYELALDSIERSRQDLALALQLSLDSLSVISDSLSRQADSIALALRNDSLAQLQQQTLQQVQATKERMNRNEIFLMSVNPARSDYMFGLEFNFYNCFQKTISKIEISVIPVDAKGRLQRDRFKRDERTVRCMGPVYPGSPAQYTFDELFWDDSGHIKYMRVTDIIFHFTDGSRKAFSGHEKILKHTLNR